MGIIRYFSTVSDRFVKVTFCTQLILPQAFTCLNPIYGVNTNVTALRLPIYKQI